MRCEYCGQITRGVECRKCGAPMPDTDAALVAEQWRAANIAGSRKMQDEIDKMARMEWVIPEFEESPDWIRRNQVNNAAQMVANNLISPSVVLKHMGEPDPEGAIQSFAAYNLAKQQALVNYGRQTEIEKAFPYPAWISRSLVNWRTRGQTNEPQG